MNEGRKRILGVTSFSLFIIGTIVPIVRLFIFDSNPWIAFGLFAIISAFTIGIVSKDDIFGQIGVWGSLSILIGAIALFCVFLFVTRHREPVVTGLILRDDAPCACHMPGCDQQFRNGPKNAGTENA